MERATQANVLIIEDDEQVHGLFARVLRRAGHSVAVAATGAEGVRELAETAYDVAVLDVNLPGIGGMEVLRLGRGSRPDTRFVVLTGAATVDMAVEAMKLGAYDFLCKPVAVEDLLVVVEAAAEDAADPEARAGEPAAGEAPPSLAGIPLGALARVKAEVERELIARAAQERWNLDQVEQEYILEVLRQTNGHQSRAAEILGMDRRTLYRKLRRYRSRGAVVEQWMVPEA